MTDKVVLQNTKKRFENLRKLADKNNGYIEPTLYDVEIDEIIQALQEIQQYREIGTVEEFKALKEKSVAKEMDRYHCPICRHYFEDTDAYNYCPVCGQKMKSILE